MYRRMNLFLALFLAFTLVLLFPVFIHTALYQSMYSIIKGDAVRSNQSMLFQINHLLDSRLREVEQMAAQLSYHPKLRQMLERNGSIEEWVPTYEQYTEIMNLMVQPTVKNELLYDYYMYFRQQGAILTPYTKTDPTSFYANYYAYQNLEQSAWLKAISGDVPEPGFLQAAELRSNAGARAERVLTYILPFPSDAGEPSLGALVFLIQEKQILSLIEHLLTSSKGQFLITDRNGTMLTTSSEELRRQLAGSGVHKLREMQNAGGDSVYSLNGEEWMMSSVESTESGWVYYSLVPKSVFMSKLNKVQIWALSLLFFCLFFGVIGAYMFAKLFYKPVRKLVRYIQNTHNLKRGEYRGEYRLIEETMLKSWDMEQQLKSALSRQTPAIQANLLNRLIKGLVEPGSLTAEALAVSGIRFETDRYAVVVMEADDSSTFTEMEPEHRWAIARGILLEVSLDLVNRHHTAYALELDRNRLALLVNLAAVPDAMELLETAIGQARSVIEEQYGIYSSIGVSEAREGLQELGTCYGQAMLALEYRIVTGNGCMIRYADIMSADPRYFYPIEVELQLMNAIKTGDFATADRLLDHIHTMNFQSRSISLELGKCLYFNMLGTLLKIWNDLSGRIAIEGQSSTFDPVKQVQECQTLLDMHEEMKAIYRLICTAVSEAQQEPGSKVADEMARYIDSHYGDHALSLNSIAEAFRLTPQYTSHLFKKWKGQNLADYMARVRVEQTKRLLQEDADGLTLSQIADSVGYASDAALIRVFKKYESVTPGRYREQTKGDVELFSGIRESGQVLR
ncbi:helix-turn-helix domain-containing protein [Paenibacillus koleovorans]|uniref:helix-turn-helix domain-containing protein n=1 Tax=Paenibacillus koleovorans TaxID=121608 RepID=UPI000FD7BC19|nr:helix-turn-helix domain-containing protein [Paenibacillus koleovorans]